MRQQGMLALTAVAVGSGALVGAQGGDDLTPPPAYDPRIHELIDDVSAERIEADIRTLVGFGTRHTRSETESETRGIGAARRWISAELLDISETCGGCLEVAFQRTVVPGEPGTRIPVDTEIVNVVAIIRGATDPNRYVIMSGDIDNRISDPDNFTGDSPGANDNASGMAGTIEAARVLSRYAGTFNASILLVGLSGEENGLLGGAHLAGVAREEGWEIEAVLNNDMIGNIEGVDGEHSEQHVSRLFGADTGHRDRRRTARPTGGRGRGRRRVSPACPLRRPDDRPLHPESRREDDLSPRSLRARRASPAVQ